MSVIKFIRDIERYFKYPSDDNPTTQQDYQNAVRNWVAAEGNLVDCVLWQPTTAYAVGNMVKTPSLPSQWCLVCTTAGTSGANEPSYSGVSVGDGVSDGGVTWIVSSHLPVIGGAVNIVGYRMDMMGELLDVSSIRAADKDGNVFVTSTYTQTNGAYPSYETHLDGIDTKIRLYKPGSTANFEVDLSTTNVSDKRLLASSSGSITWNGQPLQTSSDKRLKQDFSAVPTDILDAWANVEWKQFKYKADAERKGDSCRWHTGLVAQDVHDICGDKILKYGILCHDVKEATEEQEAVDMWTVRYTEALCMEVIYLRHKIADLESRLQAVENRR